MVGCDVTSGYSIQVPVGMLVVPASSPPTAKDAMVDSYDTIISRLGEVYDKGHSSGDLYFFPSTTNTHEESGVEVSHTDTSPPVTHP